MWLSIQYQYFSIHILYVYTIYTPRERGTFSLHPPLQLRYWNGSGHHLPLGQPSCSLEILFYTETTASHRCCRFVDCTSMMLISRSSASQGCSSLANWDLVSVEAISAQRAHCQSGFRLFFPWDLTHDWSVGCTVRMRCTWSATMLPQAVTLQWSSRQTTGIKVSKKKQL